ncbi:MAG: sugar phosphate isomerase/epimerase [Anaerolineales bacterium]|nr:sugar phosphate isomerase/epimerase [Anaerolineales bacterium]
MQLSCLPVSFFSEIIEGRMSIADWAVLGKEVGLDAIDISILFIPDRSLKQARQLRQMVEQEGMRVTMMTSYPDFTHPDAKQRQSELEAAIHSVQLAAEVGARFLRVTAGQAHPETPLEDGCHWAIEGLNALVDRTAHLGVQLVYENHAKPGVWQYTDFSQPPEIFLHILTHLDQRIQVNFDTGNATSFSPQPLVLLETVLPRLGSIHASDTAQIGTLEHVLIGTGKVDYPAIFRCLQSAGWDGWICIEEASFQGEAGVRKAVQFIRETWKQILLEKIHE